MELVKKKSLIINQEDYRVKRLNPFIFVITSIHHQVKTFYSCVFIHNNSINDKYIFVHLYY